MSRSSCPTKKSGSTSRKPRDSHKSGRIGRAPGGALTRSARPGVVGSRGDTTGNTPRAAGIAMDDFISQEEMRKLVDGTPPSESTPIFMQTNPVEGQPDVFEGDFPKYPLKESGFDFLPGEEKPQELEEGRLAQRLMTDFTVLDEGGNYVSLALGQAPPGLRLVGRVAAITEAEGSGWMQAGYWEVPPRYRDRIRVMWVWVEVPVCWVSVSSTEEYRKGESIVAVDGDRGAYLLQLPAVPFSRRWNQVIEAMVPEYPGLSPFAPIEIDPQRGDIKPSWCGKLDWKCLTHCAKIGDLKTWRDVKNSYVPFDQNGDPRASRGVDPDFDNPPALGFLANIAVATFGAYAEGQKKASFVAAGHQARANDCEKQVKKYEQRICKMRKDLEEARSRYTQQSQLAAQRRDNIARVLATRAAIPGASASAVGDQDAGPRLPATTTAPSVAVSPNSHPIDPYAFLFDLSGPDFDGALWDSTT